MCPRSLSVSLGQLKEGLRPRSLTVSIGQLKEGLCPRSLSVSIGQLKEGLRPRSRSVSRGQGSVQVSWWNCARAGVGGHPGLKSSQGGPAASHHSLFELHALPLLAALREGWEREKESGRASRWGGSDVGGRPVPEGGAESAAAGLGEVMSEGRTDRRTDGRIDG